MRILATFVTLFIGSWFAVVGSQGQILSDLSDHTFTNVVFIVLFILIGYIFSRATTSPLSFLARVSLGLAMGVYFFSIFISFMDGHAAGWSPSTTILDKIEVSFFTGVVVAFSGKELLIALAIGLSYQIFFSVLINFLKRESSKTNSL